VAKDEFVVVLEAGSSPVFAEEVAGSGSEFEEASGAM
jgi:hypothetical protein